MTEEAVSLDTLVSRWELADLKLQKANQEVKAHRGTKASIEQQMSKLMDEMGVDVASAGSRRMQIRTTKAPQVTDWKAVHDYVREHNAFHLLHRRISADSYAELIGDGGTVPGLEPVDVTKLQVTKRRA